MAIENLDEFIPIIDVIEKDEKTPKPSPQDHDDPTPDPDDPEEDDDDEDDLAEPDPFTIDDDEEEEEEEDEDDELPNLPVASEKALAKASALTLKEIGLISPEKDIESYDELEELLKTQAPQSIANALVEDLPDFGKNLALFVLNKGAELTKEDLREFYDAFFEDENIESISFDEDSLEDAKKFLKKEYKAKGMRESVINKTLDALEVEDELLTEANAILEEKKNLSKAAEKTATAVKSAQEKREDDVKFVRTIREQVSATKWAPERQKKVLEVIQNNKIKNVITDAFSDPKALVALANLVTYYDFEKKEFDLTDFLNQKVTKEVEKTKQSIFRDAMKSAGAGSGSEDSKNLKKGLPNGLKPIL